MKTHEKIINQIKSFQYISFDIFDTLLKRDIPDPIYVFRIMEEYIKQKAKGKITDFSIDRINAEKKARTKKNTGEVTLDEIYACIENPILKGHINELIELETEIEFKISCPNFEIQKVFNWCVKNEKYIVLISDTYLSEEFIRKLLDKSHYSGYKEIFLSSAIQKRKNRNGELFSYVCRKLAIRENELIHIGDSLKSDRIMAKLAGCNSIIIRKKLHQTKYFRNKNISIKDKLYYEILKSICNNRPFHLQNSFFCFGYEGLGPLLAGFSGWLYNELEQQEIKKVYFFARDGLIMKKIFDELYGNTCIQSYYLEVSRRSLRVPQLWMSADYGDIIKTFSAASMQSIVTFFDTLGLDYAEYSSLCKELGINSDYVFKRKEMQFNKKLIRLYKEIKNDVIDNSLQEYKALIQYLKQNQFEGKTAVVDIGWRGSMQKFLFNICKEAGIEVDMHGYYIGLASGSKEYTKEVPLQFKGYVFDCNSNEDDKDIRNPFVGLIETLFLAQTGSVRKYYINPDRSVSVVNYPNEYEEKDGGLSEEAEKVVLIQQGALKFAHHYKNTILFFMKCSPEIMFKNIYLVGINPSSEELRQFGDMEFRDGEVLKLASPKSFINYCICPKSIIKDFYNSRWKIGFMKRLLRVPLPYEKIYKIIKKL